jgi:glucosamine 6-phosphate synthetase-like amidotransferase/phosphosugar isomerase protein
MAVQYVIEDLTSVAVRVELASEFRYRHMKLAENSLVIIISQSGETADSLAALRSAKENGIKTLIKQHPTLSISEIENINRKMNADPRRGFGPHQTGGAIDIILLYKNKPVDMGGEYMSNINSETYSKNLTNIQKTNRKILITALESVGFQNYPNEWWHWSYGDRAYAAYKNKRYAIYGKI